VIGNRRCEECGSEVSRTGAPRGLCEKCLVRLALDQEDEPAGAGHQPGPSRIDAPERIGPYHNLQKLGVGGMGVVYQADQQAPVRRTVALKLIKAGMDTEQVIARFESERQALALMDHAGIARVYDAGATEQGRPYFVMEYVRGEPITRFCDSRRLTIAERLELFAQVCEAVQHAHHKGVIHRDLKPSNVLVTELDGNPVPKIIDFGVAKATQQRLTERTFFTELGAMIGTPEYMSPEQAGPSAQSVDTRTDVYSLGVLLYELLVGALPFEPAELRRASYDEICRRIREEEPPRPSRRLSTVGGQSSEAARRRGTDARTLTRQLRGDLDWITMKALEKDRDRRYGSPNDLATDLRRHIAHEPVAAGPPHIGYRVRKFARRHRLGVSAAAVVFAALIVGIMGTTYGLVRAQRAESEARHQAATAERVSEFLVDLFAAPDPRTSGGETVTAREILDVGVQKIDEQLAEEPQTRARILRTMGRVYTNLGMLADAEPLLEQALATEGELVDQREKARALQALAWLYLQRGRYDEAEQQYLRGLEIRRRELGEEHPDTAAMMSALGNLYRIQARWNEADELLPSALEILQRMAGRDDPKTLTAMGNLAELRREQGRNGEAGALFKDCVERMRRVHGADHMDTLTIQRNLALTYKPLGRYDEAERLLLDAMEQLRRILGDEHPRVLQAVLQLAQLYKELERYDEAERFYRQAAEGVRKVRGASHPATIAALNGLGDTYRLRGRFAEAESILLGAIEQGRRAFGDHATVGASSRYLALTYRARGRLDESSSLMYYAVRMFRENLGDEYDLTRRTLVELAGIEARRGLRDAALERLREAVDAGYSNPNLAEHPDFESLRGDPDFQALAEAAKTAPKGR
jgi:non-specific serine/threonine protein kinase/serine/threonine-protein kinase